MEIPIHTANHWKEEREKDRKSTRNLQFAILGIGTLVMLVPSIFIGLEYKSTFSMLFVFFMDAMFFILICVSVGFVTIVNKQDIKEKYQLAEDYTNGKIRGIFVETVNIGSFTSLYIEYQDGKKMTVDKNSKIDMTAENIYFDLDKNCLILPYKQ